MEKLMNDPWADDLFNRKQNAEDIMGYVESRFKYGSFSGEKKTQVIAVDAEYGIGKTFFLQRLKIQLEQNFPVAYIDAWSDDFLGRPIIALAATLEDAFRPILPKDDLERNWKDVAATTGKVAWIATKGISLQLAKLALSSGAVVGIEEILGGGQLDSDATRDAIKEGMDVDDKRKSDKVEFEKYFDTELAKYREAKSAIASLKYSLSKLSRAAESSGRKLPVFIIIDELDRCRPDYALQVLEEIKHVFGISEICFILGVNSEQLHKSIEHQYGNGFNGRSYLERFVDRYYLLEFPNLKNLCRLLLDKLQESDLKFHFMNAFLDSDSNKFISHEEWIAKLLAHYNLGPRSVFKFFDRLQMSVFILRGRPILMNYLCELIAADMSSPGINVGRPWNYFLEGGFQNKSTRMAGADFFRDAKTLFNEDARGRQLILRSESVLNDLLVNFVGDAQSPSGEAYGATIKRAARFISVD
jgi:KAP family P-loop domain